MKKELDFTLIRKKSNFNHIDYIINKKLYFNNINNSSINNNNNISNNIKNNFNHTDKESNFNYINNNQSGFNLFMMSIVILIIGILMGATLSFYRTTNAKRRVIQTEERLIKIEKALKEYVYAYGGFPCPASLKCDTDGCTNTSYKMGREACGATSSSGVFSSTINSKKILYGAVPALSLGLSNEYIADAWGNKIVYIIPQELTEDTGFKKISEAKSNSSSISEYLGNKRIYGLFSFGRNTKGAYAYDSKYNNSFTSGTANMPQDSFTLNLPETQLFKSEKIENFNFGKLEEHVLKCPATTETVQIDYIDPTIGKEDSEECVDFSYTGGEQTFTVPSNVLSLDLKVWGAQGGDGTKTDSGGKGGYSYGKLSVKPGDKLYIIVGGKGEKKAGGGASGGYNGGGKSGTGDAATTGGGGGATDIRYKGNQTSNRVIVAGGGGGAVYTTAGKAGGGGSSAGVEPTRLHLNGSSSGIGADGESKSTDRGAGGGGGGGGYIGGASGKCFTSNSALESPGGGGSGYIGGVINGGGTSGTNSGNGKAKICYKPLDLNGLIDAQTQEKSKTFDATGATQTYIIPDGISSIKIQAYGAVGETKNSVSGGKGGYSYGTLAVSTGDVLKINVGTTGSNGIEGFNGGGAGGETYGAGGGRTDVYIGNTLLLVAAGGGGAGSDGKIGGNGGGGSSSGSYGTDSATCGGAGGGNGVGGSRAKNCSTAVNAGSSINGGNSFNDSGTEAKSNTFGCTGGEQSFTVPAGVTSLKLDVYGAQGGTGKAKGSGNGKGGYSYGTLAVSTGDVLKVIVGCSGSNTSSVTVGGSGGGGSAVLRSNGTVLIVAGGAGGAGNGLTGGAGGGGSNAGGSGSMTSVSSSNNNGANGGCGKSSNAGGYGYGSGGSGSVYSTGRGCSGGGGGYKGGDAGGKTTNYTDAGAGGSGYIGGVTNGGGTTGGNSEANGRIIISYSVKKTVEIGGAGGGGYGGGASGTSGHGGGGGGGYINTSKLTSTGGTSGSSSSAYVKITYREKINPDETETMTFDNNGCLVVDYYDIGKYKFKVPDGVNSLNLDVFGAEGGSTTGSKGGKGGYSYGTLTVSPGDILQVITGEMGQNANFTYKGAGGGGGSAVLKSDNTLLIVAGGGGGAGLSSSPGGAGGGGSEAGGGYTAGGGGGGSAGTGGRAGSIDTSCGNKAGYTRTGGRGCSSTSRSYNSTTSYSRATGNGGNGYGAGGGGSRATSAHGSGGGGGGYIGGVKNGGGVSGVNSGNGKVIICNNTSKSITKTYTFPAASYGEISFAEELCARQVSYPPKRGDYYYRSTYKDGSTFVYNKPTKKCGKYGKWESGFENECVKMYKCLNPIIKTAQDFSKYPYPIVHTGIIVDENTSDEYMCISYDGAVKYYKK